MGERKVRAAMELSLRRMAVSQLDMLQFHWWDYRHPGYVDALRHITTLTDRASGERLVRNVALTNFDTEHLRSLREDAQIPIAANQIQFSLLDRRPLQHMVPYCKANGVGILACALHDQQHPRPCVDIVDIYIIYMCSACRERALVPSRVPTTHSTTHAGCPPCCAAAAGGCLAARLLGSLAAFGCCCCC
jgi:hypothetical protein